MQTKHLTLLCLGILLLTGFRPANLAIQPDKRARFVARLVRKEAGSLYLECLLLYDNPGGAQAIGVDKFTVNGSNLVGETAARFATFALKQGYVYTATTWFYQNKGVNLDPLMSWDANGVNAGENDLEVYGDAIKL